MRFLFMFLVLSLISTAHAQETVEVGRTTDRETPAKTPADGPTRTNGPPVRHITDSLLQTPEARQSLDAFHRAKEAGTLSSAKTAESYAVGDTAEFNVFNVDTGEWMPDIPFVLERKGPSLYLWVEQAELDSNFVRQQDADSLFSALQERTPPASYDPSEGIIVNNNDVFGQPSDIDNNDRVHVLLTDVIDGREESSEAPFVAGFFHPSDLNPNSSGSQGNSGEVLYLDTRPGIYTDDDEYRMPINLQATAAHEYQHLIHANYDINEEIFVNEGLSEWAEIVNGYPLRPAKYLARSNDSTGYNVTLFLWRGSEDNVLYDYQRAGLFTHYLAEQVGLERMSTVTQSPLRAIEGYNTVLDNRTFSEFLLDFHTANSLNDVSYDPAYGYRSDGRRGVEAAAAFSYDSRTDRRTPEQTTSVSAGAVKYLEWHHVRDLNVTIDANATETRINEMRGRFRVRAIAVRDDGTISERTVMPRQTLTFEGAYDQITLVVAHAAPQKGAAEIIFSADWQDREDLYTNVRITYDSGAPKIRENESSPILFTTGAANAGLHATRFAVPDPESAILSEVSFAFYFLSQFENGPSRDSPRDFNLHVWDQSAQGVPGEELLSVTMDDPRSYSLGVPSDEYDRFSVDLSDYESQLSNLPDTIFVGVSEAGTDENYTVLAPSPYTEANTSFIGAAFSADSTSWTPLWQTELQNGVTLENTTLPTRAHFLVTDTTLGNGPSVPQPPPDSLALGPNYPNPFNASTRIDLQIPEEAHGTLKVYDVLGRHVATLVDGVMRPNMPPITVRADNWSSGVYFYVVEYQGRRLSRKMMLIK